MSPKLPQEIFDDILAHLSHTRRGRKALKRLSLVCRSFLHSARTLLFRRVTFKHDSWKKLDPFFQKLPHLIQYVNELIIADTDQYQLITADTMLPQLLRSLAGNGRLREITLCGLYWWGLHDMTRQTLYDLIHTESLRCITISYIQPFLPPTLLQQLPPGLKSLTLMDTWDSLSSTPENLPERLPQLTQLTIYFSLARFSEKDVGSFLDGLTTHLVDVTELQKFTASFYDVSNWPAFQRVIERTSSSLLDLHIDGWLGLQSFTPLDLGNFHHLENLLISSNFSSHFTWCSDISILWLARSLRTVPDLNAIRTVTISSIFYEYHLCIPASNPNTNAEIWEQLDAALARPQLASSSTFQRINFRLGVSNSEEYHDMYAFVRSRLPRTRRLGKLHIAKGLDEHKIRFI